MNKIYKSVDTEVKQEASLQRVGEDEILTAIDLINGPLSAQRN